MTRNPYPTDLTDAQWALLEPLLPPPKPGGRPRSVELREIVNALVYVLGSGCPWRHLPHDRPPWPTVWTYFWCWRDDGTLDRLHDQLRTQVRQQAGRDPTPSAAILDSQSVKTAEKGGHATTLARRFRGASAILSSITGSGGTLIGWVRDEAGWEFEVVTKPPGATTFVVLPHRWIVERTFAWLGKCRRLSKDYEHLVASAVACIRLAMIRLMVRRLEPASDFSHTF